MARSGKLVKIAELDHLPNVFQQAGDLKGNWRKNIFKNDNPIIVELGCGKGEYTVNLARMFPQNNYIGVDIKGARLWKGAKISHTEGLDNVAFIRTLIENITDFFAPGEVNEIWVTFPDPYPKPCKDQKRLVSQRFLNLYRQILAPGGIVNFKTDNAGLFEWALNEPFREQYVKIIAATNDLYSSEMLDEITSIKTTYEGIFTEKGHVVKYAKLQFV